MRSGLTRPGARSMDRPEPDEPAPQPEHGEPKLPNPRLRDLTFADWKAVLIRSGKEFLDDNGTLLASALAYSSFFAIPSVLLVVVGLFTLIAGPDTITNLIAHLHGVMPGEATSLLDQSLKNLEAHPGSGVFVTILGFVLAIWSTTGAMNAFMTAINVMYERKDARNFVRKRVVALMMAGVMGVALLLVAGLLIFGPTIEHAVSTRVGAFGGVLNWLWWIAQWPILLSGLLVAFAVLLFLGPDVEHRRWAFLTPGSLVAAVLWIAVSGLFAVYTSTFASYNKTWGSLSAVIVTLTWLWLTSCALLFGAEINAELERTRELRER